MTSLFIVSLVDVDPSEIPVAFTMIGKGSFFQNIFMNVGQNILTTVHVQFFAVSM